MVSFWPWRRNDTSPASFEKILLNLSTKISHSSRRLDNLRQRSRRLKVLWTLYATFAYLLCTIILILVVGWREWGPIEYTSVAGGPVIVYLVRLGLSTYYEYRTSSTQSHLDELQKHRDSTIEQLKAATKYNDTQDLLQKYGGTPNPKKKPAGPIEHKNTAKQSGAPNGGRPTFVPPPTANIPDRRGITTLTKTPQHSSPRVRSPLAQDVSYSGSGVLRSPSGLGSPQGTSAEFVPNAFSAAPQYSQAGEGSRWYDRVMDVLLGEDETLPRARLALICSNCRLVNGQAPPGVKRLEDVGKWRCGGCGATNGKESEVKKIVASIKKQASAEVGQSEKSEEDDSQMVNFDLEHEKVPTPQKDGCESDITQYSSESSESVQGKSSRTAEPQIPARWSTRSKRSGDTAS
ncbi:hypothetical protein BDR22DRAFT_852472 [Usnea florida]